MKIGRVSDDTFALFARLWRERGSAYVPQLALILLLVVVIAALPGLGTVGPLALSGLGVGIGVAVTAPERRYLATLGLTPLEARAILARADRTATLEETEA